MVAKEWLQMKASQDVPGTCYCLTNHAKNAVEENHNEFMTLVDSVGQEFL